MSNLEETHIRFRRSKNKRWLSDVKDTPVIYFSFSIKLYDHFCHLFICFIHKQYTQFECEHGQAFYDSWGGADVSYFLLFKNVEESHKRFLKPFSIFSIFALEKQSNSNWESNKNCCKTSSVFETNKRKHRD